MEDNVFARKIIKKGLLYFKSKVVTVDSTGEVMEYVIAIDKSKKLHLEIEGKDAHRMMENCEEFIDDVATGRIDPKVLRELPEENKKIKEGIQRTEDNQERFDERLLLLSDTVQLYIENTKTHINALTSLTRSADTSTEAVKKIEKAAETAEKTTKVLIEATSLLKEILEENTARSFSSRLPGGDCMKKGKLLEVLRIAVMYTILEKEGTMGAKMLGSILGCKRDMVIEYVEAHKDLFELTNNGVSSKKVSLSPKGKRKGNPQEFILGLISFGKDFCDVPSDEILTRRFIEWFEKILRLVRAFHRYTNVWWESGEIQKQRTLKSIFLFKAVFLSSKKPFLNTIVNVAQELAQKL